MEKIVKKPQFVKEISLHNRRLCDKLNDGLNLFILDVRIFNPSV